MLPFQIKICGVKRIEDAESVVSSGADAIGFNFYEPSPRFVESETAIKLAQFVDDSNRSARTKVKKVGVFVNASVEDIVQTASRCGLDGIQLHGDESPTIVAELKHALSKSKLDCFVARAIRSQPNHDQSNRPTNEAIELWSHGGADLLLLDAAVPGEYGGTGHVLDWHAVVRLKTDLPLTLAGGLTHENVSQAILISGVQSVDVASGVEAEPGIKDHEKVMAFVKAAQSQLAERRDK